MEEKGFNVSKDFRDTRSATLYIQAIRVSDPWVLPGTPGYLPVHTKAHIILTSSKLTSYLVEHATATIVLLGTNPARSFEPL